MKQVPVWKRIREVNHDLQETKKQLAIAHARFLHGEHVGKSLAALSNRLKTLESRRRELNRELTLENLCKESYD